jgi:hypothetical protein
VRKKLDKLKKKSSLHRRVTKALEEVSQLPPYKDAPEEYTDWGLTGPYKVKTARGECAA